MQDQDDEAADVEAEAYRLRKHYTALSYFR